MKEEYLDDFSDTDSASDEEELGQGPTKDDKEYMFNVRNGVGQQIWNARSLDKIA